MEEESQKELNRCGMKNVIASSIQTVLQNWVGRTQNCIQENEKTN